MAQTISVLGIDIAKLVFHVVGMDDSGQVVLRKRIARSALLTFITRSYWIPGSYETSSSMSAPSNALPRFRTL
jgi:hypothetical protein